MEEVFGGCGNIVDGPALQWLNRQAKPHFWVSDGGVSGVGDSPNAQCTAEVRALTKLGAVTQVRKLKDIGLKAKDLGAR